MEVPLLMFSVPVPVAQTGTGGSAVQIAATICGLSTSRKILAANVIEFGFIALSRNPSQALAYRMLSPHKILPETAGRIFQRLAAAIAPLALRIIHRRAVRLARRWICAPVPFNGGGNASVGDKVFTAPQLAFDTERQPAPLAILPCAVACRKHAERRHDEVVGQFAMTAILDLIAE